MRLLRLILMIVVFCFSSLAFAQTEGASLDERGYGVYVPRSYDANGEDDVPLVIGLHGFGDTWQNFYPATGLAGRAEEEGFIFAFPQAYLNEWNDGSIGRHEEDDVQLLRDLVERIDRDFRINRDRIYLVGFSNGGTMVYRAACEAPDLFAGIVAVGGTMRSAQADECEGVQIPVLVIHGTGDEVVPFDGNIYRYAVRSGVAFWARRNECDIDSVPAYSEALFENGYRTYFFSDCPDGNLVMLHALQDVGHIWPGFAAYVRGLTPEPPHTDTARLIWGFFDLTYQARLDAEASNPELTPEASESQ